jgi:hypothetical protein
MFLHVSAVLRNMLPAAAKTKHATYLPYRSSD